MAEHDRAIPGTPELHLLVLRCQTGDDRAFAQLMDRFGPRTLRYLRGLTGDSAEDVQQEVWITVYRSIAALANTGAFRTWLFRTTRNRALDWLRGEKRDRELFDDSDTLQTIDPATEANDPIIDDSLLGAVRTLSAAHREVCLLRYWDDLSYAEIALVTGCSIGTVRSRLHHAKRQLRDVLTAHADTARLPHDTSTGAHND